ncbi:hypothetical protein [Sanguibacter sp. Z1732]|uniref:hypothetical protein n=1 Tax=Sanguibacter sp. Z1732 TaxID=3435412 RepID=UPI003D9CBBE3
MAEQYPRVQGESGELIHRGGSVEGQPGRGRFDFGAAVREGQRQRLGLQATEFLGQDLLGRPGGQSRDVHAGHRGVRRDAVAEEVGAAHVRRGEQQHDHAHPDPDLGEAAFLARGFLLRGQGAVLVVGDGARRPGHHGGVWVIRGVGGVGGRRVDDAGGVVVASGLLGVGGLVRGAVVLGGMIAGVGGLIRGDVVRAGMIPGAGGLVRGDVVLGGAAVLDRGSAHVGCRRFIGTGQFLG